MVVEIRREGIEENVVEVEVEVEAEVEIRGGGWWWWWWEETRRRREKREEVSAGHGMGNGEWGMGGEEQQEASKGKSK